MTTAPTRPAYLSASLQRPGPHRARAGPLILVAQAFHKHGGKYLPRSGSISAIEGEAPDTTLIALLEFPSTEAVDSFVNDPAYAKYRQARRDGSISNLYAIDDTDLAGTIPYLAKA